MQLTDMAAVQAAFANEKLFPPPAAPGAVYWLRSRVARFSHGPEHAHRRALAVAEIARVDPSHAARLAVSRIAAGDSVRQAIIKAFSLVPDKCVDLIIDVAPSYFDPSRPTQSLEPLLDLLGRDEATAARIGVLVQACEATAALVDNDLVPPARTTKRVAPDGTLITLDLSELPFGAPPRECPGKDLALTIASAIVEARRDAAPNTPAAGDAATPAAGDAAISGKSSPSFAMMPRFPRNRDDQGSGHAGGTL
ncbi:hypothetical protein [Rhizocola hellebori]|nr:hypothetical protein [Rhizocola hellebori]